MMSGVDLPLKTQGEIHQFFDENYGTEYIQFESSELTNEEKNRVSKYHFIAKRKKNIIEKILYKVSLMLQLKIDRTKKSPLEYRKGANWFSITDDLAQYVVKNKKIIQKYFRRNTSFDERSFREALSSRCLRRRYRRWRRSRWTHWSCAQSERSFARKPVCRGAAAGSSCRVSVVLSSSKKDAPSCIFRRF